MALKSKLLQGDRYIIDQSLESMVRKRVTDPDTKELLSWLKAVSIGGLVACEKKQMLVEPPCKGPVLTINMTSEFKNCHGPVADAICTAAKNSKGKWLLDKLSKTAEKVHDISRKRDVVTFLLQARRPALSDADSAIVTSF